MENEKMQAIVVLCVNKKIPGGIFEWGMDGFSGAYF